MCTYAHMNLFIYIYTHVFICIYNCLAVYVCLNISCLAYGMLCLCKHIYWKCLYDYLSLCVCTSFVRLYINIHIHVYTYIYIHAYIYIYLYLFGHICTCLENSVVLLMACCITANTPTHNCMTTCPRYRK